MSAARRWCARALVGVLLLGIAGCGWYLRGAGPDAASLDGVTVDVVTPGVAPDFARELRRAVRAAGAELGHGGARLVIESESRDRQALSVGSARGAEEFELRYRVRWRIDGPDGDTRVGPDTLEQFRGFRFDREDVLGSEGREEALLAEMRRDAAGQLAERLRSDLGE